MALLHRRRLEATKQLTLSRVQHFRTEGVPFETRTSNKGHLSNFYLLPPAPV
jgi:hypothetical protein